MDREGFYARLGNQMRLKIRDQDNSILPTTTAVQHLKISFYMATLFTIVSLFIFPGLPQISQICMLYSTWRSFEACICWLKVLDGDLP
jgi:hypothetical protein